jgi:hypothetical protein
LNTNVEQHCYENRIGEDEILLEDKEKCFTEPAFPTGEKWSCSQVKKFSHLLIGVGVGPCVNGEHTLMHKLQGGSADDDSKDMETKLKELSDSVTRLEQLSSAQAKRLQELEKEKVESKSKATGTNSPLSSKVKCTNGNTIRPEDESRQVSSFLGIKAMKPMLKNRDSINVLLKYYIRTANMDNITVSTAWTYLSITLQSLNTNGQVQEAVNSYNNVKEQIVGVSQTWMQNLKN